MFLKLLLVVFVAGKLASSSPYIPHGWNQFCRENVSNTSLPGSHSSIQIDLRCFVLNSPNFHWKLNDLRDWTIYNSINNQTTPSSRKVIYSITVTCDNMANISLPWPMRVAGLQVLHVSYCRLVDKYKNINDPADAAIDNDLRTLELRHCAWILNQTNVSLMDAAGNLNITSRFDCGQDSSIETFIASNVSDVIMSNLGQVSDDNADVTDQELNNKHKTLSSRTATTRSPSDLTKSEDHVTKDEKAGVQPKLDQEANQEMAATSGSNFDFSEEKIHRAQIESLKLINKMLSARTKCNYSKLRRIDESMATLTPQHHFDFMVQGALYPELENMDYSYIGLKELPKPLAEWRVYFPKLKYLNLSHNYIREVKVKVYPSSDEGRVIFNIRNNNITFIDMDILRSWARVEQFFVDIQDNPIHCGCDLSPMLPYLENNVTFQGDLAPYEYVRHLRCHTPKELFGIKLHTLTQDSLQCPVYSSSKAAVITLSIVMVILIVAIIVIIKFKVEIRILLYTRLHVRLPCDVDAQTNTKTFDAFVSYSNEDTEWVRENLIKFLEKPSTNTVNNSVKNNNNNSNKMNNGSQRNNSGTTFKLCVHQRDFIPGKTIFDNIVDSIEASRHTIIVLSSSFMRSHWAMEELRQAYRQSLVEKTRHLIVILLDKVSKDEMDPLISRCCKTFTYLEANDSLFKDKLVFSLSTKDKSAKRRDRLAAKEREAEEMDNQNKSSNVDYSLEEVHAYGNEGYSPTSGRPAEPARELSNMSTSSTTPLT